MTKEQFISQTIQYNPCQEGVDYVNACPTWDAAWQSCDNPQWMLWAAVCLGKDVSFLRTLDAYGVDYWMDIFDKTEDINIKCGAVASFIMESDSSLCDFIRANVTI